MKNEHQQSNIHRYVNEDIIQKDWGISGRVDYEGDFSLVLGFAKLTPTYELQV